MKITIPKLHPEPERQKKIEKPKVSKVFQPVAKAAPVDYRNIVSKESGNQENRKEKDRRKNDDNFVDNHDVPPLF